MDSKYPGKIAVVTGASSGMGETIAKELLKRGVHVAGLARRVEKLEELCKEVDSSAEFKGKFYPIKCDVTRKEDITSAFNYIFENLGPVHILINNAAVLEPTYLTDAEPEMVEASFDVNVKAVILCTKEVIKNMEKNKIEGHVINMNSLMGHVPFNIHPNVYMLYSSTKHALKIISEGLRREMIEKNLHIKISNLSPAYVDTPMTRGLNLSEEFKKKCIEADRCGQGLHNYSRHPAQDTYIGIDSIANEFEILIREYQISLSKYRYYTIIIYLPTYLVLFNFC